MAGGAVRPGGAGDQSHLTPGRSRSAQTSRWSDVREPAWRRRGDGFQFGTARALRGLASACWASSTSRRVAVTRGAARSVCQREPKSAPVSGSEKCASCCGWPLLSLGWDASRRSWRDWVRQALRVLVMACATAGGAEWCRCRVRVGVVLAFERDHGGVEPSAGAGERSSSASGYGPGSAQAGASRSPAAASMPAAARWTPIFGTRGRPTSGAASSSPRRAAGGSPAEPAPTPSPSSSTSSTSCAALERRDLVGADRHLTDVEAEPLPVQPFRGDLVRRRESPVQRRRRCLGIGDEPVAAPAGLHHPDRPAGPPHGRARAGRRGACVEPFSLLVQPAPMGRIAPRKSGFESP